MTPVIFAGDLQQAVLLDANVLLLLCVGMWDRSRIKKFKRARVFTEEDFDLLTQLVSMLGKVVTTTHVWTELSNLAGQHGEPERSEFFQWLVGLIPLVTEYSEPAQNVIAEPTFVRLGLTDAAIQRFAKQGALHVITTDTALWEHLLQIKVPVIHFNHVRQQQLFG